MQAIVTDLSFNSNAGDYEVSKNSQTQVKETKISFEALISQANEINKIEIDSNKDLNQNKAPVQEVKKEEPVEKKQIQDDKTEVSEDKKSTKKINEKEEAAENTETVEDEKLPVEMNIGNAVVIQKQEEKETKSEIKDDFIEKKSVEQIAVDENAGANLVAMDVSSEVELNNPELNLKNIKETDDKELKITNDNLEIKSSDEKTPVNTKIDILENKLKDGKTSKIDKEGKITVKDLRTEKVEEKIDDIKPAQKLNVDVKMNNSNTATITMDYANQISEENILSLNNQTAASDGSNFQAMLNNQIQQNVPEFVKAGSVILKDNNQGTINLVLHPDDLGNVKIHLSLDGKTINGHIIVATKEAMEVFKDNAQTLREAFIKNGFDGADFNVSYNNNSSGNNGQEFSNQFDDGNFLAKKIYGNDLSSSGEIDSQLNDLISSKNDNYSVNIVA
ncbi:MAG: flagellar hook-length control protein FliK [Treponema sp.]|nr:flagellar hook-length control protein FliK [Treponema sp.]